MCLIQGKHTHIPSTQATLQFQGQEELYEQFTFLFEQLGVKDTRGLIAQYVTDHDFHRPFPEEGQIAGKPKDTGDDSGLSD